MGCGHGRNGLDGAGGKVRTGGGGQQSSVGQVNGRGGGSVGAGGGVRYGGGGGSRGGDGGGAGGGRGGVEGEVYGVVVRWGGWGLQEREVEVVTGEQDWGVWDRGFSVDSGRGYTGGEFRVIVGSTGGRRRRDGAIDSRRTVHCVRWLRHRVNGMVRVAEQGGRGVKGSVGRYGGLGCFEAGVARVRLHGGKVCARGF